MKEMGGMICGRCKSNDYMLFIIDKKIFSVCRMCSLVSSLDNVKSFTGKEGNRIIGKILKNFKSASLTEEKKEEYEYNRTLKGVR